MSYIIKLSFGNSIGKRLWKLWHGELKENDEKEMKLSAAGYVYRGKKIEGR